MHVKCPHGCEYQSRSCHTFSPRFPRTAIQKTMLYLAAAMYLLYNLMLEARGGLSTYFSVGGYGPARATRTLG